VIGLKSVPVALSDVGEGIGVGVGVEGISLALLMVRASLTKTFSASSF